MNREIKFRVWEQTSTTMDYDIDLILKNPSIIPSKLFLSVDSMLKIMQFTGLHDKNGKEIYEGDVLKTKYQDKAIMIWHKEFSCFCFETIDEVVKGEYQYSFKNVEIEIIGNIYENPELLDSSIVA